MADLTTDIATYRKRLHYRPLWNAAMLVGIAALLIGMAVLVVLAVRNDRKAHAADAQRVTWVAQARDLGAQIARSNVCTSTDPADLAQFGYLCDQARKVKDEPDPKPVDTQALAAAVSALVVATLPERVDAAVQRYMLANPLASKDEIREWVKAEVAAVPPIPGGTGAPGPPATSAQIDAAVAKYLAAHPPEQGPTGPIGPPGEGGCPGAWEQVVDADGELIYRCRKND